VARIADTNGDGFDDWIVGAPFDDGDGNATTKARTGGRAFFFYGGSTPDGVPDVTFTGPEGRLAVRLRGGFGRRHQPRGRGGHRRGRATRRRRRQRDRRRHGPRPRVRVLGGSALDATPDLILTGDENGAHFGASVAVVLDVNNDGVDDLLVGAPLHDAGGGAGANRGRAYVFFGGSPPDATADVTLSGTVNGGSFGAAVSRAGDANGDGVWDFLVGAPLEDPGRAPMRAAPISSSAARASTAFPT